MALIHDLSFSVRQFFRHRVYAASAIISMALGIGSTAAVYSVLYGVLIDPYPYRNADRIAFITIQTKQGRGEIPFTLAERDFLRDTRSVEDAFVQSDENMIATDGDIPQSVKVLEMTGNGLQFLGAPPMLGRVFTAPEIHDGAAPPPVAVISYLFWKSHFASDPNVLGKMLELNKQKYTVIGVVGPRFTWHDCEVYLPMPAGMDPRRRFETLVRLRPGVSTSAASGELSGILQQIRSEEPNLLPKDGYTINVQTLNDWLLGQFKGTLLILFAAVGLLLLIGCGNVSILMLARGTARLQELATRLAIGASRVRVVRQLLIEAVMLSVTGGLLGMAFAYAAIQCIVGMLPEYSIPHEVVIRLNLPVLVFSTAVSVAVGILAGLSPALQFSTPHICQMVQSSGSRSTTSHGARTRMALITGQIALTVLMLAGAGAATRNFIEAYTTHLGFETHNVLTLEFSYPERAFATWEAGVRYQDALIEAIRATPGVVAVANSGAALPPTQRWLQPVQVVGSTPDAQENAVGLVSAEFFSVLRIPLLEGRIFTRDEVMHGLHLACVNKSFVDRYFAGSDPIGKLVLPSRIPALPSDLLTAANIREPFQIIGVVGDVRNDGLHRPPLPAVYLPSSVVVTPGNTLLVRTTGKPESARPCHRPEHPGLEPEPGRLPG
jgi:predicted permease